MAEVALALVLLTGAGLLARTLHELVTVDAGVETDRVLTMRLTRADPEALRRVVTELLPRLEALPGVQPSVSATDPPSIRTSSSPDSSGRTARPAPGDEPIAEVRRVGGNYSASHSVGVVAFDGRDTEDAPTALIINERLARQQFPGEDPVGKRLSYWWGDGGGEANRAGEIVGVVGDVRSKDPWHDPAPAIYVPFSQLWNWVLVLTIRTAREPEGIAAAARAVAHEVDPNQPVADVRTLDDIARLSTSRPRLNLILFGGFAGISFLLSAVGLYGVVAHSVIQRRQEMGIRLALGAGSTEMVRLVLAQGMRLTAAGVGIGIAGALVLGRLMTALLFGVSPMDPITLVVVPAGLAAAALLASYLPARAAARVDPQTALRGE